MATRADLGSDWHDVLRDWYLIRLPSIGPDLGWRALGAVERHLPEYLDGLRGGGRGLALITSVVELGRVLLTCEGLAGFDAVLARIKHGEVPAISELRVADALVRAGYRPTLEPPLRGKRLDASIDTPGGTVYVEVIAPTYSDAYRQAEGRIQHLALRLTNQLPGVNLDVHLHADPDKQVVAEVLRVARELVEAGEGSTRDVPGTAVVRYHPGSNPPAFDPLPEARDPNLLSISFAHGARAAVKLPFDDARAERLMTAETHHFSPEEMNVLIIDVGHVPDGIRRWTPLVQRRFQPTRNRRFGAVALFQDLLIGFDIVQHWSVLSNPHARHPVANDVIDRLSALHDIGGRLLSSGQPVLASPGGEPLLWVIPGEVR